MLQHPLRDAQLAGHDVGEIIDRITADPMDGARSVSSVLHGRLQRLQLPGARRGVTWAQRTPENAPALAHELAAGLDERRRELGERALANPEPWLTRHLGPPPGPEASPALREDYARRAGTAAAYREARGITDPHQAVSFDPHPEPELEAMRQDTFRALEIADEQAEIRAMCRGELEARVLEGDRAQATAPPDVSSQLRLTAQAEADAWQQSADAHADHDQARADNARTLATAMAAEKTRLEAANARYEQWSARTASTREIAGQAKAELARRGQEPATRGAPEPQTMAEWWRQFQADADAVDRAIEREHHAAVDAGQPWPPKRKPEPGTRNRMPLHPGANRSSSSPGQEYPAPRRNPSRTHPSQELRQPEAAEPVPANDGRAARLDELQARADAGRAPDRRAAGRARRQQRAHRADGARGPGRAGGWPAGGNVL